ncbi:hypothetical protein HDV00_008021 [Rhizophlyctis rosea]|nr:hypothetical protein HDV00_008021 [Rhizophlyctis rosea]
MDALTIEVLQDPSALQTWYHTEHKNIIEHLNCNLIPSMTQVKHLTTVVAALPTLSNPLPQPIQTFIHKIHAYILYKSAHYNFPARTSKTSSHPNAQFYSTSVSSLDSQSTLKVDPPLEPGQDQIYIVAREDGRLLGVGEEPSNWVMGPDGLEINPLVPLKSFEEFQQAVQEGSGVGVGR